VQLGKEFKSKFFISHSQVALGNVTFTKAMLKLFIHKKSKAQLKKKSSFPSATWEGVQN